MSGQAAIEHDLDPVFADDLKVGELFIAIPIALVILVFVFGTLAFLVPFIFAAFTIPATLGIIWIFANFMELTTYLQNLVMLIGLGIAVDYSLLVVYRYREELRKGGYEGGRDRPHDEHRRPRGRLQRHGGRDRARADALHAAAVHARLRDRRARDPARLGRLRADAAAGPPLLARGAARPRAPDPAPVVERRDSDRNGWYRLAHAIMRRPALFAAGTTALLLALATPVLALELGPGSNDGIPQDLEGVQGLNIVADAVGDGALAPSAIVVDTGRAGGVARRRRGGGDRRRLVAGLEADPEVASCASTSRRSTSTRRGRYPQRRGDRPPRVRHAGGAGVRRPAARRDHPGRRLPARRRRSSRAAGRRAASTSSTSRTARSRGSCSRVLVLTYLLLMRAFRSLLLPLKAIVMNLLSIGAAYGLLVLFFKYGGAESIGLIGFDQIEGWIPVFIFAMVFGLSMDYEVFLVSRMREEWDAGLSNAEAVAQGLAKTGRIVTAAGLIMVAAFMGFVAGSIVGLQQFGFGLAMAILLDVTIVRALLVPSVMELMGRWNWWLPGGVARVVRVAPSPLARARPARRRCRPAGS